MSWRALACAALLLGLVSAGGPATAAEPTLSMRVSGDIDRDSGALTLLVTSGWDGTLDFGAASNLGPEPRNGERVRIAEGRGAHYVATFMVEVLEGDASRAVTMGRHPRRIDRTRPRHARAPTVLKGDRGAIYADPLGPASPGQVLRVSPLTSVETVDLYAQLAGVATLDGSLHLALGDDLDWSAGEEVGVPLEFTEVLVASDVPLGSRIRCQLGLFVPDTATGRQQASVRFTAKPGGGFTDLSRTPFDPDEHGLWSVPHRPR
ncbi:MAG: hypothetical protein JRI25_19770 [Deltaproteobacteria bacterium]|nr:hypothetical protein [Deltaproteobacteria bacterium]